MKDDIIQYAIRKLGRRVINLLNPNSLLTPETILLESVYIPEFLKNFNQVSGRELEIGIDSSMILYEEIDGQLVGVNDSIYTDDLQINRVFYIKIPYSKTLNSPITYARFIERDESSPGTVMDMLNPTPNFGLKIDIHSVGNNIIRVEGQGISTTDFDYSKIMVEVAHDLELSTISRRYAPNLSRYFLILCKDYLYNTLTDELDAIQSNSSHVNEALLQKIETLKVEEEDLIMVDTKLQKIGFMNNQKKMHRLINIAV